MIDMRKSCDTGAEIHATSSKLLLLRGPILWSAGVSCLMASYSVWASTAVATFPPLAMALTAFVFLGLSIFSTSLFWNDVYQLVLKPTLQPAVAVASNWSLDDILAILCDPNQLASYLSALVMLPVTLYTLPTTSEQRARVLYSAGLLPENAATILNQAGGWKLLLPYKMQQFLQRMEVNADKRAGDAASLGDSSSESGDEQEEDDYFPYSVSPVYRRTFKVNASFERMPADDPQQQQQQQQQQYEDPHELMAKIVADLIKGKLASVAQTLQQQQPAAVLTAVTATAILVAQMRYSRTARACAKNAFQLVVTAGASTALSGSLAALLAPLLAPRGERGGDNSNDWRFIASTLAAAAYATIPRTLSGGISMDSMRRRFPWKGAVAALVLFYFQHRRRRRLERAQEAATAD